jgi:hypothetical protein
MEGKNPMLSSESPDSEDRQAESVKAAWEKMRAYLENKKARIYEEIRNYPRPIPGCDQQFNHLLEERARVARELNQIDEAFRKTLATGAPLPQIDEILTTRE